MLVISRVTRKSPIFMLRMICVSLLWVSQFDTKGCFTWRKVAMKPILRKIAGSLYFYCCWIELRFFGVFFGFVFVICGWNSLDSFVCGDSIHFKRLSFSGCTFITFLWSCLDMSPGEGAEKVETDIFIPLRKTPAFHLLGSETFAGLQ